MEKAEIYQEALTKIVALIKQEDDIISATATVTCELHHAFDYFHWTGFYRHVGNEILKVGPYQGGHGCLMIPFSKGVCGAAARLQETQLVKDVNQFEGHIACSATTQSEIVVPIVGADRMTAAVLDIDSDLPNAFDAIDKQYLEELASLLSKRYFH